MKGNIKSKLVELRLANENRHVIFDDIFGKIVRNVKEEGLCDCMNVDDFEICYNGLKTKWINMGPAKKKFVTYFSKYKVDHIRNCMSAEHRSVVGLSFPPKLYTQSSNECINSIIKRDRNTKKTNLKEIAQLCRSLTRDQEEQVKLSLMGRSEWSLDKKYKSLFQNELNRFYQMLTPQRLQFLKTFNNSAVMGEGNETLNLSITPEDSGCLYPPYSILVEIFKEADELLLDGIGYAPGAPDKVNTQNVMEPIIVIFNRDNGIGKCKSACDRFKAYNLCEHSLSVAENEGPLNRFLQYLKQRQSSRFIFQRISNISNVEKSGNIGKKNPTKSTS